jgi:hypothetical protein
MKALEKIFKVTGMLTPTEGGFLYQLAQAKPSQRIGPKLVPKDRSLAHAEVICAPRSAIGHQNDVVDFH